MHSTQYCDSILSINCAPLSIVSPDSPIVWLTLPAMLVTRCEPSATRYAMLVTRCELAATRYTMLVTRCELAAIRYAMLVTRYELALTQCAMPSKAHPSFRFHFTFTGGITTHPFPFRIFVSFKSYSSFCVWNSPNSVLISSCMQIPVM